LRNAQDEALAQLARQRALVTPAALERAEAARRDAGTPVAQLLVQAGVLGGDAVAGLLRELAQARFGCARCRQSVDYVGLARLPRLRCPRCGEGLAPLAGGRPPSSRRAPEVTDRPTAAHPLDAGSDPFATRPGGTAATRTARDPAAVNDSSWPSQRLGSAPSAPRPVTGAYQAAVMRRIGPYRLLSELGRGSNGVVYLAQREGLSRRFALKVLRSNALDDPEAVARFHREADLASKLEHPGIVGVFDFGEDGGIYYYAMEYARGQTLKAFLAERAPMAPGEAVDLVEELARTVHFAHEQGVIHRDLKPANVILDPETGRPRVTDFGLARDRSGANNMTQTGDVVGTPVYMSPEQFRGERVDRRADVYALGVILYEALAGARPFEAGDPASLAELVLEAPLRPPSALEPGLPKALDRVAAKALARERGDRYESAGALVAALRRARDRPSGRQPAGRPVPRPGPTGARGERPASRSPWLVPGLVVGAVAALTAAGLGVAAGLGEPAEGRAGGGAPTPAADGSGAEPGLADPDLVAILLERVDELAADPDPAAREKLRETLAKAAEAAGGDPALAAQVVGARQRAAEAAIAALGRAASPGALEHARSLARGDPDLERRLSGVEAAAERRSEVLGVLAELEELARAGRPYEDLVARIDAFARELGPDAAESHEVAFLRAEVAFRRSKLREVVALGRRVEGEVIDRWAQRVLLHAGRALYYLGEKAECERLLEAAERGPDRSVAAIARAGRAYAQRYGLALESLADAPPEVADELACQLIRAAALCRTGRWGGAAEESLALYERLAAEHPDHWEVRYGIGFVLKDSDRARALEELRRAGAGGEPPYLYSFLWRVRIHVVEDRPERAAEVLEEARAHHADAASFLALEAAFLAAQERDAEAQAAWARAMAADEVTALSYARGLPAHLVTPLMRVVMGR